MGSWTLWVSFLLICLLVNIAQLGTYERISTWRGLDAFGSTLEHAEHENQLVNLLRVTFTLFHDLFWYLAPPNEVLSLSLHPGCSESIAVENLHTEAPKHQSNLELAYGMIFIMVWYVVLCLLRSDMSRVCNILAARSIQDQGSYEARPKLHYRGIPQHRVLV